MGGGEAGTKYFIPPPLSVWRSGYFKDGIFGDARTCINNTLMPFHHKPFRVSGCLLKVLLLINNQKEQHFLDSIDCYKQPLIWSVIQMPIVVNGLETLS